MPHTARYWVDALHKDYVVDRGKRESTWKEEYEKIYKRLPLDEELTLEIMHAIVLSTKANSRTRIRACMATSALAEFAGINYDPSPYRGSYTAASVQPRDIPSDDLIVECFLKLKNPAWRWYYGMIATYGLRPHECFRLDLDLLRRGDEVVHVGDDTKTGFRRTWPYYQEWFESFGLGHPIVPPIKLDRANRKLGEAAGEYFKKTARLPFCLYDLRHAWAVRVTLFGLPESLAAQQMGHSLEVHNKIYQRWIGRKVHQAAYEATLKNPHRPQPPSFPK